MSWAAVRQRALQRQTKLNAQADVTNGAILHIPHSSRFIPQHVRATLLLFDAELKAELIRMTDSYTDDLFFLPGTATSVVFPVSRLVVDPERFVDDTQEPMVAKGMGAVYTHTSDGHQLRRVLSSDERELLIQTYYEPHHANLTRTVDDGLRRSGRCLILDCHSFPSVPLPYELDQSARRPDICIGTDEYHTPGWLSEAAASLFREGGFQVELNRPFAGALVPMAHYRRNPHVWSVMIEVNRSLYMDEGTGERTVQFESLRRKVQGILQRLVASTGSSQSH